MVHKQPLPVYVDHQSQVVQVADVGLSGSTITLYLKNVLCLLTQLIRYNSFVSDHKLNTSGQSPKNSSSSSHIGPLIQSSSHQSPSLLEL
jgi:hypothetical protein